MQEVLAFLSERGYPDAHAVHSAEESLIFALPKELRRDLKAAGRSLTPPSGGAGCGACRRRRLRGRRRRLGPVGSVGSGSSGSSVASRASPRSRTLLEGPVGSVLVDRSDSSPRPRSPPVVVLVGLPLVIRRTRARARPRFGLGVVLVRLEGGDSTVSAMSSAYPGSSHRRRRPPRPRTRPRRPRRASAASRTRPGPRRSAGLGRELDGVLLDVEVVEVTEPVDVVLRFRRHRRRPARRVDSSSRCRATRRSRRMTITTWNAISSSSAAITTTNHLT